MHIGLTMAKLIWYIGYYLDNCFFSFRSSQIMDLTKVLPTVSGASLNMTVLVLHSSATEVEAKLSLKNFLLGLGPLETLTSVSHQ